MSRWHDKGNRNDAQRTGVNSQRPIFQSLYEMKFRKTSANLTFARRTWPRLEGGAKASENSEKQTCKCALLSATDCRRSGLRLGVGGQTPLQCSLWAAPQWALWCWKAAILPTAKCISNTLCADATGIEPRQPPRVPDVSAFDTSTFQMTTSRMTRNSSKFLASGVPIIPAGTQKRRSLFFAPENNGLPRHYPNASHEANERFVGTDPRRDLPPSVGPWDFLTIHTKCRRLKKAHFPKMILTFLSEGRSDFT